ncbi:HAD family hydrolase [Streptomyces sp. NPDC001502]|uniref:HAD family hydrolase n=1 Tax=Streptomyces sp. NPDC001502 TaxID=3364578 RepID=UPI0036AC4B3F
MATLLMLDLDNTLIDRDAAFRSSCSAALAQHRLPAAEVEWLMAADASGYTPRETLARAMSERYGPRIPEKAVATLLADGGADRVTLPPATREALTRAAAVGWHSVIVTNGRTKQQETKIRNSGLDALVHGWVISESVGHKKPAPEIFRAAAALAGAGLESAWMIGDSPAADIAGAHALSVRSVWVSPDRPWRASGFGPTHTAPDVAAAITHVLEAGPVR